MLETTLLLGTMPAHLGVPLADLMAWALLLAFLAAPAVQDAGSRKIIEIGGAKSRRAAAGHPLDTTAAPVARTAPVKPAASRLSPAEQWTAMSRIVTAGADHAMAVARDQQAIRRELDSLDLTIENLRRELASVMTVALPVAGRSADLVALPVRRRQQALAA